MTETSNSVSDIVESFRDQHKIVYLENYQRLSSLSASQDLSNRLIGVFDILFL